MSQASYLLPVTGIISGLAVAADINASMMAVATMNSGASAPGGGTWTSAVPAGSFWLNTSTTPYTIEIGDGANWLVFGYIDQVNHIYTPKGPTGVIFDFAGPASELPPGCLLCYGQSVLIASYPDLYVKLGSGSIYGATGSSFTLPDKRGIVSAGLDNMGGSAAGNLSAWTTLGYTGGAQSVTLSAAQLPVNAYSDSGHNHSITDPGHLHGLGGGGNFTASSATFAVTGPGSAQNTATATTGISVHTNTANISNPGGGGSHTNTQPTIGLNSAIWI